MKTIFALSICLSVIALPALGELTDADLNEIRLIVKEEIDASEKQYDAKIQANAIGDNKEKRTVLPA